MLAVGPPAEEAELLRRCANRVGWAFEARGSVVEARAAACQDGVAALIVAADALDVEGGWELNAWLSSPEPASHLPVLLLHQRGEAVGRRPELRAVSTEADVTPMQRPADEAALAAWLDAARADRRQPLAARLHELEDAARFGRTLVSVLSHDLRTPLAAARLSAEVILRSSRDERALRSASRILSSTQRMQRLIEQLLDFSRVRDHGVLPLHVREADAADVCRAVISEQEHASPEARLSFEERGDALGEWDPDRLAQLLTSVLMHAIRQSGPGELVPILLDGTSEAHVWFRVQHGGVVAGPAALFDPFPQHATEPGAADFSPAGGSADEGLGLALFVAREIARGHGGDLEVEPDRPPGQTTFSLRLPRRPPREP